MTTSLGVCHSMIDFVANCFHCCRARAVAIAFASSSASLMKSTSAAIAG